MNRTWLRIQSRLHSFIYRMTNGRLGRQFGAPVLLLTTIGRKSGKPRTTPLYYLEGDHQWSIVASNAGSEKPPAWWLNLQSNTNATIQVQANQYFVTGREASKEERAHLWSQFIKLFAGYESYQETTERVFPVIILERNKTHLITDSSS